MTTGPQGYHLKNFHDNYERVEKTVQNNMATDDDEKEEKVLWQLEQERAVHCS